VKNREVCYKCFCTFDEDIGECECMDTIKEVYLTQVQTVKNYPYEYYWQSDNKRISPNFDLKIDAIYWAKENLNEDKTRINW